jgi:hypothetical protein
MRPDNGPVTTTTRIYLDRFKQQSTKFTLCCRFWGCGTYCSTQKSLEDHELLHPGGIKCVESSCPFSRMGFTSAAALKQHNRKYHLQLEPEIGDDFPRRKYVCSGVENGRPWGCHRRFAFKRELERHITSCPESECDKDVRRRAYPPDISGHH